MKKLFYATVLCLFASTFTFAQNLITNPGFETVTDGVPGDWTNLSSSTLTIEAVTGTAYAGSYSLKVISTYSQDYVINYVPVTPGKTYDLSVWYNLQSYTGSRSSIGLSYTYADADGNNLNNGGQIGGAINLGNVVGTTSAKANAVTLQTWQQIAFTTTEVVPATATYIGILLKPNQITAYYDNASVTEAGSAGINEETTTAQGRELSVRKESGNLIVSTESGKPIEVYSAVGAKLQSKVAKSDETVISGLPKGQVLVVRSGNAAAKVVL